MLRISVLLSVLVLASCFKMKPDASTTANSTSSPVESSLAIVSSLANESENITLGLSSFEEQLLKPSCKGVNSKSDCNANNQVMVSWGECTATTGATYRGGWVNTYNNTNACKRSKTSGLANGDAVTRTSDGMTIDGVYGDSKIVWSSKVHTTYDNQTIYGTGVTLSRMNDARILTIGGMRRTLMNSGGATLFDHSIVSLSPMYMTGQRSDGTRYLSGGVVRVYSNTEKTRSDLTFSDVRWQSSQCCYPTSGQVTSVTSGARTETATVQFDQACGQASLTINNQSTRITLHQCE